MSEANTRRWIESATGGRVWGPIELVQELWSGFGRIDRVRLEPAQDAPPSVILKSVDPGTGGVAHPRGWNSDLGVQRKLRSYRVERTFYTDYAAELAGAARVPHALGARETPTGGSLLLEDLDAAGFGARRLDDLGASEIEACVEWLAAFHGSFLGASTSGLWERGTYWHLATRPEELKATADDKLREAAPKIDACLAAAEFTTLVHGDAKVANFCFPTKGRKSEVAAVDFQYVGGGIGVQDVAYFMGSCMDDNGLERDAARYLDHYFERLRGFLPDAELGRAVEADWRALWPLAWADFHRFLAGWAPGHWKLSRFSTGMLQGVLASMRPG